MKKTAMQLHIIDMHNMISLVKIISTDKELERILTETLLGAIENAESHLKTEIKQINNAYYEGGRDILADTSSLNMEFFGTSHYHEYYQPLKPNY